MLIDPINFTRDVFYFPNNLIIKIDFGVIDDRFKDPFISDFGRLDVKFRRSQLYMGQQLITEIIEDNPDYLTDEEEKRLIENHIRRGEEYKKIINFLDGKTLKVEYWETSYSKGDNLSIYDAEFRKSYLYDSDGSLISELIESNPHYIDDSLPVEEYVLEDGFLD